MKTFTFIFLLLSIVLRSSGGSVINSSSTYTLPKSAQYHALGGRFPSDGTVQNQNPPSYQWLYYENPDLYLTSTNTRMFVFQLTTNGSFSSPLQSITTSNNFYNFQPPVTNADGSTWTGTNQWRIVYEDFTGTPKGTSEVWSFTMPSNAHLWDRSAWASDSYLQSKGAAHPHLYINSNNIAALRLFLPTNNIEYFGYHWSDFVHDATNDVAQSWWNSTTFTNQSSWYYMGENIARVGAVMLLTTNSAISNLLASANPGQMLEMMATNLLNQVPSGLSQPGYDKLGGYQSGQIPVLMARSYDWLYNYMTTQQRSNVLYFLRCDAMSKVYETWLFSGTTKDYSRAFTNPLSILQGSQFREGDSHDRNGQNSVMEVLAGMGESAELRSLAHYYIGYNLSQFDPFQGDDGRAYNTVQNFAEYRQFEGPLCMQESFPELGVTNAPIYQSLAQQFCFMEPVGFGHGNNLSPFDWGVQGGAPATYIPQTYLTRFFDVACFLQNGAVMQQYQNQKLFTGAANDGSVFQLAMFTQFFFPIPAQTSWPSNYFLNGDRGWWIAMTKTPDDTSAFTNGVGVMLQARPSGAGSYNAAATDGQFEMWAYGAHINVGGAGAYSIHPMFQNNPLFVDGIGVANMRVPVAYPVVAQFNNVTNSSEFSFASADFTYAYPHTNWDIKANGSTVIFENFYKQPTNARPYITGIGRSVLFVHHTNAPNSSYAILYDTCATSQAADFETKWASDNPTNAVISTNGGMLTLQYSVTNNYNGSNVMVYVAQCVDPTLLSFTNLSNGTNLLGSVATNYAKLNPFTGEWYTPPNDPEAPDPYWPYWGNSFWLHNKSLATNWNNVTLVIPVKWDQPTPTFGRLDNNTFWVNMNNGQPIDTNTLGTDFGGPSTFLVSLLSVGSNAPPPTVMFLPWGH